MQTTATQAITSSVRRYCSVRLYFLLKESIFYLNSDGGSLVVLYVVSGSFRKGDDFGGSGAKIASLWELQYVHRAGAL